MRRLRAFSLLLVIILLGGGLGDRTTAAGALSNEPPTRLVPADLIPPAMTTLAVEGNFAYVGTSSYLLVVDVSDPDNPHQVAYAQLPAPARQVAATSQRVYVLTDSDRSYRPVVTGGDQVQIFDITNPTSPRLASQIGPGSFSSLDAKDFRLYLLGNGEFSILDTSDAHHPVTLGSTPSYSWEISVTGSQALLASDSTFQVMDVFDPTNPTMLGELPNPGGLYPPYITDLSVEGDVAAVAGFSFEAYPESKCVLIDLEDPAHPAELSSIETGFNAYPSVALAGQRLYFTPRDYSLAVYDISDLRAPVLIGYGDDPVWNLASASNQIYVAAGASGFAVYDSLGPDGLLRRGGILGTGTAEDVEVQGDSLYIADGGLSDASYFTDYSDGGLAIAAIHHPEHAEVQGRLMEGGHGAYLAVQGNQAYLTAGNCFLRYTSCDQALFVMDVTQPEAPSELGNYAFGFDRYGSVAGPVSVQKRTVYVSNLYGYLYKPYGLAIVDVSQPVTPTLFSYYTPSVVPPDSSGIYGSIITGTYGLVSAWTRVDGVYSGSLQVIDVSNPFSPTLLADYPMNVGRVFRQGSLGFVTVSNSDSSTTSNILLRVIDLSALPQVQVLADIPAQGPIYDLAYDGHYAYIAKGEDGLRVVDLSDLTHPVEVFTYDTPGKAVAVVQEGEWVYLADRDGGLLVFRKVRNFMYLPLLGVTGAP
jgi:hypothetical protein